MSKLFFTIPLLLLIVFISGCAQQEASGVTGGETAGAAMQRFLDNLIAGNHESAVNQMISLDGEPPSAEVKAERMSDWETMIINSYQIISESAVPAAELAELSTTATMPFSEVKAVTITLELQQPTEETVSAPYLVVKHEGEWKIVFFD